jgi:hypothetical protein
MMLLDTNSARSFYSFKVIIYWSNEDRYHTGATFYVQPG